MTSLIDSFASVWYYFMFVSFAFGIVGVVALLMWQYGKSDNASKLLKISAILIGQLIVTWIIGFGTLSIVQNNARKELLNILDHENVILMIAQKELKESDNAELIQILKSVNRTSAHHSHPTSELVVQLAYNNHKSNISLLRDSERPNEYWVYWDKYRISSSNEIGRITNERLMEYKSLQ